MLSRFYTVPLLDSQESTKYQKHFPLQLIQLRMSPDTAYRASHPQEGVGVENDHLLGTRGVE